MCWTGSMLQADITTIAATLGTPNEDAADCRGDAVVLMDGAGMPSALRSGCTHSVDWFSHTCVDRYLDLLADPGLSMQDALAATITQVADLHRHTCDLDAGSPSATVVAVRRAGDRLEYLVLCDSTLGLVTDTGVRVVTDNRLAQLQHPLGARLRRVRASLSPQADQDDPELLAAWREHDRAVRNTPDGFWCVGHRPQAAAHALTGSVPMASLRAVVLASDGAMRRAEIFGELTCEELIASYAQEGSCYPLEKLRAAENAHHDESIARWRKPHDDATVAVWRP